MKAKNKRILGALLLAVGVSLSSPLWLALRPVEIIAVYDDKNFSDVLVKNFPFTDKGKISWWVENRYFLKDHYFIPKPSSSGHFSITFWSFGDGYKEKGKYDRLCFDSMKTKVNCIEKDAILIVSNDRDKNTFFTVDNGRYMLKKDGEVVKIEDW